MLSATMRKHEKGVFLIEALVALLIFSIGILGLVAMSSTAINTQSDAQYRTEAAMFANDIVNEMFATVPQVDVATMQTALAAFIHNPTPPSAPNVCTFGGGASANARVTDWANKVSTLSSRLPGTSASTQQILVQNFAGFSQVVVTVCWQGPSDAALRRHVVTAIFSPMIDNS